MTREDYRIIFDGERFKVQERYFTFWRGRETWRDATETYSSGMSEREMDTDTVTRVFPTVEACQAFIADFLERIQPAEWRVVKQFYPTGVCADRETGVTESSGIRAHRDQFGGMSAEIPGHDCPNCKG